ncbi:HTH_Tnp_Tc3_2 domain-containing protein [Trichonephila clavipes]|uniref:HTH_Tnp_Tc3_2 domain-containing protein n=1 Tax=Trichonephila clavipes TaxID=2585209 RepID=A0A8X7BBU9_TRICX|nr:HTH_Tnp_Tc3_2 domain-containing protein [Trichonephila clavipes]
MRSLKYRIQQQYSQKKPQKILTSSTALRHNYQCLKYTDCSLSYRNIDDRVGRDPMTVSRIWNRWVQDGNKERHAGSQRPSFTSSRKDRHVTRMTLTDRAATS